MRPLYICRSIRRIPVRPIALRSSFHCKYLGCEAPITVQRRCFQIPRFLARSRESQVPDLPPGKEVLATLLVHIDRKLGVAPNLPKLTRALSQYLRYLNARDATDEEVYLLKRTYEYIGENALKFVAVGDEWRLSKHKILRRLLLVLRNGREGQLHLARSVFRDVQETNGYEPDVQIYQPFIKILCNAGRLQEAIELCRSFGQLTKQPSDLLIIWNTIFTSLENIGDENTILKVLEETKDLTGGMGNRKQRNLYFRLISFYVRKGNMQRAQEVYEAAASEGLDLQLSTDLVVLEYCLVHNNKVWGNQILEVILAKIASESEVIKRKKAWDIALWYSAGIGFDVDQISLLLEKMKSLGINEKELQPDILTVNRILTQAVVHNNPELVKYCIENMKLDGITPNLRTLELKMEYSLNMGDLPGATEVFEEMKYLQNIPQLYTARECLRLMRSLAEQALPDIRLVSNIYRDIFEWKVQLDVGTLAALLKIFLEESSFPDVTLLVKRHVGHLSDQERDIIIELLVAHCHRPTTTFEAALQTYMFLVRSLPSVSTYNRERLMLLFFEFDKPEIACKVLTDMTLTDDRKPDKYHYTVALVGVARARSRECLRTVHRQLNMEAGVEPDTILLNALMRAYSTCGLYHRAFIVYDDIARSPEGPDSATVSIFFDLCGHDLSNGLLRARTLWNRCLAQRVALTENNVASYIECLSRHQKWQDALEVVKTCEKELGFKPGERM